MNGLDRRKIQIIEDGNLEKIDKLSEEEKETALKILDNLSGHFVIRADKILNFCKKVIKYKTY